MDHPPPVSSTPTMATFDCGGCDFRTNNYSSAWRRHLILDSHQERARDRVKTMDTKTKKRTAVVFGVVSIKEKAILKYFGDFLLIMDFIFWKNRPDFCIITFLSSQFLDFALKTDHIIDGKKLFLRSLHEIPEAEWVSICPFAAPIPMEVDLTEGSSPEDPFKEEYCSEDEETDETKESLSSVVNDAQFNGNGFNVCHTQGPSLTTVLKNNEDGSAAVPSTSSSIPESTSTNEQNNSNVPQEEIWNDSPEDANFDTPYVDERVHVIKRENEHQIDEESDPETMLNQTMEDLYDRNLRLPKYDELRKYAKQKIEVELKQQFPNCVLIPFGFGGSTDISSGQETLSIYIDVKGRTVDESGKKYTMDVDRTEKDDKIKKICNALRKKPFIHNIGFENDKISFTFLDQLSTIQVECKLQVANFLAVQCCRIVNFFCKLDTRVRALLIIIRHWAYHRHLVMSNHGKYPIEVCFNPHVFQWLVVMFLIHEKILPSIETLQCYANTALLHGGVNIAFCDNPDKIGWEMNENYNPSRDDTSPSARCMLSLAQRFFKFFGESRLKNSVCCVNIGCSIPKRLLKKSKTPNGVFKTAEAWESTKMIKIDTPLCVQNPLKLYLNMTPNVSNEMTRKFRRDCRSTSSSLLNFLNKNLTLDNFENPVGILTFGAENDSLSLDEEDDEKESGTEEQQKNDLTQNGSVDSNVIHKVVKRKVSFKPFGIELLFKNCPRKDLVSMSRAWFGLFESFNNRVWPVCFGVQLFDLDDIDESLKPSESGTTLVPPFKGVIMQPNNLDWAHATYKKPGKMTPETKLVFFDLLQKLENGNVHIQRRSPQALQPNEILFSFNCHVFARTVAKLKKSIINLKFNKVYFHSKKSEITFKNNIRQMYGALWARYCVARLIQM